MTRFARARGSKSSNERLPEEATSWQEMKQQLQEKQNSSKFSQFKTGNRERLRFDTTDDDKSEWAEFEKPTTSNPTKKKKKKRNHMSLEQNESKTEITEKSITDGESLHKLSAHSTKVKKKLSKKSSNMKKVFEELPLPDSIESIPASEDVETNEVKKKKKKKRNITQGMNEDTDILEQENKKESSIDYMGSNKIKRGFEELPKPDTETIHASEVVGTNEVKKKKKKKRNITQDVNEDTLEQENKNKKESSFDHMASDTKKKRKEKKHKEKKVNEGQQQHTKQKNYDMSRDSNNRYVKDNKFKTRKQRGQPYKRRKPEAPVETMFINGKTIEVIKFDGFPVKKEDAERLAELRKNMIARGIPKEDVAVTMKLERRKAEKALVRERKKVCFHCRNSGHVLSECPELGDSNNTAIGVCFKCGSTEHTHFQCKVVRAQDFRYAECFICKEQGHIARQCPDNPRGLYPKGGACKVCGDVTHLKKDCPDLIAKKENETITLQTLDNNSLEVLDEDIKKIKSKSSVGKPVKKGVVKF